MVKLLKNKKSKESNAIADEGMVIANKKSRINGITGVFSSVTEGRV